MPDNVYRLEGDLRDLERDLEDLQRRFEDVASASAQVDGAQKKLDGTWTKGAKTASTYVAQATAAAAAVRKLGADAAAAKAPVDGLSESERAAAEAAAALAAANQALSQITTQAAADTVTASQQVIGTYRDRLAAIRSLEGGAEEQAQAEKAALERLARDLSAIDQARFDQQEKLAEQAAAVRRAAESDVLGPVEQVTQAYEDQIKTLDRLAAEGADTADARLAAEKRLGRELKKINDQLEADRLDKQRASTGKLTTVFRGAVGAASAFAGGLLAAGEAARRLIDDTAGTVDEVGTLAAAAGLSNETVNGLRLAADAAGKSLTDLVPVGLPKKMADAANGSEEAARIFRQLGVEATDASGNLRDTDVVFGEIIDSLGAIEDPGTRAALAASLLEEQGKQLLSAFSDQSGLQRFIDASEMFAVSVAPEATKQTSRWQQANAELALAWENVQRALQQSGAFEAATKFVKDLALGTVFLTEVTVAFVRQSLERFGALKDAILNFPDITEVFSALVRSDSSRLDELFQPLQDALHDANALTGGVDALADAWDAAGPRVRAFFGLQVSGAEEAGKAVDDKATPPVVRFEKAVKAAAEAQRQWLADSDQALDIVADAEADLLTDVQRVNLEYLARIEAIQQLTADAGLKAEADLAAEQRLVRDLARIEKEKAEQTAERLREEEALERQHLDNIAGLEAAFLELRQESFRSFLELAQESTFGTLDSITEVVTNLAEAEKERLEAQLEGTQDSIDALRDERAELEAQLESTEDLTAEQAAAAKARLQQIQKELEASKAAAKGQRELINEQNAAVLAADKLARAAAVAQIVIDGARMFTGLVAFLAPLSGPAAPAIAAPIAAGVVAAQTAAVATAPPPTLHDGGLLFGPTAPDERDVGGARVLNGEVGAVLNRRAVDMGGVEVLESLNRAADLGGETRLVLADSGRVIGEAWVQQAQTRGSAVAAAVGSPSGFVNPHRRR